MTLVFKLVLNGTSIFLPLFKERTYFGRTEESNIIIYDNQLSRVHFSTHMINNKLIITDCRSKNGTYIDKVEVFDEALMESGQKLKAGCCSFIIQTLNTPLDLIIDQLKNYPEICKVPSLDKISGLTSVNYLKTENEFEVDTDTLKLQESQNEKIKIELNRHVSFNKYLDKKQKTLEHEKKITTFLKRFFSKIKFFGKKLLLNNKKLAQQEKSKNEK